MSDTTEITEMTEFDAERVDLVPQPANGIPFLVMKSVDEPPVDLASKAVGDDEVAEGEAEIPDVVRIDGEYVAPEATDSAGNEPGDPAWEAADAANLEAAAQSLVEVAQRITAASAREGAEGEWRSSYRLDDALCAVECALGIVAALSYVESAEETGVAAKAALSPIATELLGRARSTLSDLLGEPPMSEEDTVSKSEIESLVESKMAEILGGSPAAKAAADAEEATKAAEGAEVVEETDAVDEEATKAADETETEVVEEATKAADDTETPVEEATKAADDETPAVEPEEATKAADEPAAGAPEETPLAEVLKSSLAEALKEALAPFAETMKGVEERVEKMESQPAPGGPFLNGSPFAQALRTSPEAQTPAEEVAKALEGITDPTLRAQVARDVAIKQVASAFGG